MKTALSAVGSAFLLGLAFFVAGRPLDVADYAVILLATTLVAWTVEQYRHDITHHDT